MVGYGTGLAVVLLKLASL